MDVSVDAVIALNDACRDVLAMGDARSKVEARRRAVASARERMRRRWDTLTRKAPHTGASKDVTDDEDAQAFDWPAGGLVAARARGEVVSYAEAGRARATMPTDAPAGGRGEGGDG